MFVKHEQCPHWVYFDFHGDPEKKQKLPKFAEMLMDMGLAHEQDVISRHDVVEVKGETAREKFAATLRLMEQGVPRIYHGYLMAGDMAGEPDILERRDDAVSKFGPYAYHAIDIKSAERLHDAHKYQLSMYADLLEAVQGWRPEYGFIMNGSRTLLGFPFTEADREYREVTKEIRAAMAGECPAPYVSSGCKQSPWFKECVALAERLDDVTLLYNVRKKTLDQLRARGIDTVAKAARMDVESLMQKDDSFSRKTLDRIVVQARSLRSGKHFVRKAVVLPQTPTEIFFDIEGDPLRQVEYLFGFLVRDEGGERYEYQIAESPEQENVMWQAFLEWLTRLPKTYTVYHYGTYEKTKIDALAAIYGGSPALDYFRDALIDLNEIVKDKLVFPLYFYSIKDIGKYIGYERSGKITGGGESVAFYEEWLEKRDRKKLDEILTYNEDDVIATRHLKDWLAKNAAEVALPD